MNEILDKHRQDFNEIRRLCLKCHGLDLTSSSIFSGSTYDNPSEITQSILHSMISSSMLNLAVALRINLYQDTIKNKTIPLNTMVAFYYEDEKLIFEKLSIKDVCDKIIHADSVTKPIFPREISELNEKITFQLKGSNRKTAWTLSLCLETFTESILTLLDEIERNPT